MYINSVSVGWPDREVQKKTQIKLKRHANRVNKYKLVLYDILSFVCKLL